MKFTPEVQAALQTLKDNAESDFERHRIAVLEKDLTEPPKVEIVDEKHQRFNGLNFGKGASTQHLTRNNFIHRVIWEYYYGKIPAGYDIHHIDHNPLNNDISNLQMLTKKEHAAIHLALKPKEYVCEYCGKTFIATSKIPARYCSKNCKAAHLRKIKGLPHYKKKCLVCGKEFVTTNNRQKYCSKECSYVPLTKAPIQKICKVCGKSFATKKESRKYCSVQCSNESRKTKKPRTCPICGKIFTYRNNTEIYCSRSCASKARSLKQNFR